VKVRLIHQAGKRISNDGVLLIKSQTFRTQERNRQDAVERLVEMIQKAAIRPIIRRATKPTRGSQQRRLTAKSVQSRRKQARRDVGED
ncbi:aminoacyl-tRNA hydrolase, partial [bacterium]